MSLKINYIRSAGTYDEERVVLESDSSTQIGIYAVADTHLGTDGKISSRLQSIYWFPDRRVREGDLVVLYTKRGSQSVKDNPDGTHSYFFYWGLESPMWVGPDSRALLIEMANWQVSPD